ncbi:MAG: LytTR family transcriptional regulator [Bacteroidaceae bacterium]|nr:LytTR family transcriptional regulator [Bacteroidaceae bacterium]
MKQTITDPVIIALSALFVLSFLQPFGIDQMNGSRITVIVSYSAAAFTTAFASCALIRRFGLTTNNTSGLAAMHAINTPLLSAVILTLNSWLSWGNETSAWYCTAGRFSVVNFLTVCLQVMLVGVFVFIVQMYRNRTWRLRNELDEVKALNALLEQRQESKDGELLENGKDDGQHMCTLRGNANNAVFEVDAGNIIYIESMSNYADICYIDGDKACHRSLRITMKQLCEQLQPYGYLMQCHRAFVVNINFVQSISGRPSTGFAMQVFQVEKSIPVSRTYTAQIHEILNQGRN